MSHDEFLPDAVQWSEGMLLSPQHFQQNDIHVQALLHQRLLGIAPHAWGVRHLVLDHARLADGFVNVVECDAVMPDGLPLVFRATGSGLNLSLDVSAKCNANGTPVRVCLTVPPRVGALDVPTTSIRRYESLPGRATLDEVTGIGDVVVERQRARLELYAAGELPSGYPALPLLDMVRVGEKTVVAGDFHPPMLRIGASAFLGARGLQQKFSALRDAMWAKLRELIGTGCDEAPDTTAMMGAEARMHLRVARELAGCLPLLDTLLMDPTCAPAQAWHAMAQIVARMTAVVANPVPLSMGPYHHVDCIGQFQAALDFVQRKLDLINTAWDSLAFARVGDGMFARRLPDDSPQAVIVELRGRDGQTAHELQTWLGEARIAGEDLLPVLRQRRLLGARTRMLSASETMELGLRANALIWELSSQRLEIPQHGVVDTFRAGRSIVVQGDTAHAPAAIVLHHRKRAGRAANASHPAAGDDHG